MKDLVLISRPGSQHQEERILELAEWMGISTRKLTIGDPPALDQLIRELGGGERSGVISTETLALLRQHSPPRMLQAFIENGFAKLLVVNVGASQAHQDVFDWLTGGAVGGLASSDQRQAFRMPESGRRFSGAFADQSFTVSRPVPVHTFDLKDTGRGSVEKILLADERPVFLRLQHGPCELFLLTVAQLPDIKQQLSPSRGVEDGYDRLIPLLIFLRQCFGEMCWHGVETTARLIIDDPLLNPAYGFLNYGALRNSMRCADYGTTIAFIPWNYWRTSKRKAGAIFDQVPNLSICVHGCDHTNKEFEDQNLGVLQWMADTALDRMERHKSRTGVGFDPIMVFPQGKFSSAAMSALRAGGYLAAVNTTCFPTDGEAEPLTIADFLRPAITKFHGFPLFQRRYPRRLIDSAFDIFLGRPVLLVQHAEDFRDGYRQLEEFVSGLRKLEPTLTWGPLTDQLMQTCMASGSVDGRSTRVRFFTRHFRYRNRQSTRTSLVLSKEEPDPSRISGVLVDGTSVPFLVEKGLVTFEHRADAGQLVDVRILDRPRPPARVSGRGGVAHTVGVSVRRGLSEFRDNALAKRPRLLALARELARRMKVTGIDNTQKRV